MKKHLKRNAAPRSWDIDRKKRTFVIRPKSSGHALESGLPLGIILRDILKIAATAAEVKKILHHTQVLVDGKRQQESNIQVGLFDVLTLQETKESFIAVFDRKGRVVLQELPSSWTSQKVAKVVGKSMVRGGKVQLHFHDGKNMLTTQPVALGDSVLRNIPDGKINQVLPLKTGVTAFLLRGKHRGDVGIVKEIRGNQATYLRNNQQIETLKNYLFVLPSDFPVVKKQEKEEKEELKTQPKKD
ncbi:30S ribosomal protein S4e [Candidatus Woesearchaeota archaeon]|nr:30S ribosomal protein S4e [Candidatus Woesearchaeota archaeon]